MRLQLRREIRGRLTSKQQRRVGFTGPVVAIQRIDRVLATVLEGDGVDTPPGAALPVEDDLWGAARSLDQLVDMSHLVARQHQLGHQLQPLGFVQPRQVTLTDPA